MNSNALGISKTWTEAEPRESISQALALSIFPPTSEQRTAAESEEWQPPSSFLWNRRDPPDQARESDACFCAFEIHVEAPSFYYI